MTNVPKQATVTRQNNHGKSESSLSIVKTTVRMKARFGKVRSGFFLSHPRRKGSGCQLCEVNIYPISFAFRCLAYMRPGTKNETAEEMPKSRMSESYHFRKSGMTAAVRNISPAQM